MQAALRCRTEVVFDDTHINPSQINLASRSDRRVEVCTGLRRVLLPDAQPGGYTIRAAHAGVAGDARAARETEAAFVVHGVLISMDLNLAVNQMPRLARFDSEVPHLRKEKR